MPLSNLDRTHGHRLLPRLDNVLLGMVDSLGTVCRDFHRPHLKGTDSPSVRDLCAPILPTLLCLLWFGAFGGTALHQHTVDGYTGVTENVAAWKLELALFKMFDELPWTTLLCLRRDDADNYLFRYLVGLRFPDH